MTETQRLNAINAALEAGQEIVRIYNDVHADFQIEHKSDNSPLTVADRKSHEIICRYLSQTDIPILSEEGKHLPYIIRKGWKQLWIVDPLDGTKEFIKQNGEFTVNIALVKEGSPVFGVIYVPVKHVLYWGDVYEGAYRLDNISSCNHSSLVALKQKALRLPCVQKKDSFVVVASRSHLSPETQVYIDALRQKHPDLQLGSAGSSIKICWVAEGRANIYPRFAPTMEWDTAAGHAIAKAAGLEIYHANTHMPLVYNKEDLLNPWFIVEQVKR